jgi:Arc/MetJ-type ribon-helix-helix transcriptional regulator
MAQDRYRSVRLPEELIEQIEDVVKSGKFGYKSIAEFIKVAIREELKEIEHSKRE